MFITHIEVNKYRNYVSQSITLSDGVNVFSGGNAQGKTNLLEAVYLLSIGKSARTAKDRDLILWDAEQATVRATVKKKFSCESVEMVLSRKENKRVAVNGLPISKLGELMGVLHTVYFSPDELRIVKDSPVERRRFIDIAICQLSKNYFYTLTRYNKILSQRNKLLKTGGTDASFDIWDEQLAREGAKIIRTRRGFVRKLETEAKAAHTFLTGGGEDLSLGYESLDGETVPELEIALLSALKKSRDKDRNLGFTSIGPQRDDLEIKCNGIDVRNFGSQGQQRTAALSLKLAELEIFRDEAGEYPVLLLDDVLSELDPSRQLKLIQKLSGLQTIITCTHIDPMLKENISNMTTFTISGGRVI